MGDSNSGAPFSPLSEQFVEAVSAIFGCLGRVLVCLNPDFLVIHASESLDSITFDGAAEAIVGQPVVSGDDRRSRHTGPGLQLGQ